MTTRDAYDPHVAFDDLHPHILGSVFGGGPFYGIVTGDARRTPHDTARAVLHRAHRRRLRSDSHVVGLAHDSTRTSFEAGGVYIVGDDAPPIDLPVYGSIYKEFSDSLPEPRLVRVDDDESYADFRVARGSKYIEQLAQLTQRLSALEDAVAQHVADNHGGGRVAALENALRQHIADAAAECRCGGTSIPLPLDGVDSWQDGAEILCTVRFVSPDGSTKLLTSGTPAARAVNEVVGCAIEAGVEPEDLMVVAAPVAQVLGATSLAQQLFTDGRDVIDCCGVGDVVTLVPSADPAVAAAMMLLQRCQMGDWAAMQDARRMARDKSSKRLLDDAAERLSAAQAMKAGGRS